MCYSALGMIVILIYRDGEEFKRFGNFSSLEAESFLRLMEKNDVEDEDGEIWTVSGSRVDLGSEYPHLDIFLQKSNVVSIIG